MEKTLEKFLLFLTTVIWVARLSNYGLVGICTYPMCYTLFNSTKICFVTQRKEQPFRTLTKKYSIPWWLAFRHIKSRNA